MRKWQNLVSKPEVLVINFTASQPSTLMRLTCFYCPESCYSFLHFLELCVHMNINNTAVFDGVVAAADVSPKSKQARGAKLATAAAEKTLIGLAVATDEGWYYAIPKNQKLGEHWDKATCTWMCAEPSIHMEHPQEGGDVRWFRHITTESSPVYSFARFGIVTFYGAPDPQNDAFTQRTVWAVSTEDDNTMKDLYDAFLASEAESQSKQESSVKQLQESTQLSCTKVPDTIDSAATTDVSLQQLERPVIGAFGDGQYVLLTVLPTDRTVTAGITGKRCVPLCNIPGVDAYSLFAVLNESQEVMVDKAFATEVVVWENAWSLPAGATACNVCSVSKPLIPRQPIDATTTMTAAAAPKPKISKPKRQPAKRTRTEVAEDALTVTSARPTKGAAPPSSSQPPSVAYRVGEGNAWSSVPPDGHTVVPSLDQLMQSHSVKQAATKASVQTDDVAFQTVVLPSGHVATVKAETLRKTMVVAPPLSVDDDAMRQRMARAMAVAKASQEKLALAGSASAPK